MRNSIFERPAWVSNTDPTPHTSGVSNPATKELILSPAWDVDDFLDFTQYIEPYFEHDLGIRVVIGSVTKRRHLIPRLFEFKGVDREYQTDLAVLFWALYDAWRDEDFFEFPKRNVEVENEDVED